MDYEHEHGMMSVLFFSGLLYLHYYMAFGYIFAYDICDLYDLEIQMNLYTASPKDLDEIAGRMCRSHSTQWLISLASLEEWRGGAHTCKIYIPVAQPGYQLRYISKV